MVKNEPFLFHGGNIQQVSEKYKVPIEQWFDLSTGINPRSYPFSLVDKCYYQQLPYLDPHFLQVAKKYYQACNILPIPGSQSVIQLLPDILPPGNLWVPEVGYQEYAYQWQKNDRTIFCYPSFDVDLSIETINLSVEGGLVDHLLIINPNNPTGLVIPVDVIAGWAEQLQSQGGKVIIDEAFVDMQPEQSVFSLGERLPENMIVLRSFGKFFGLAGVRIGFVSAEQDITDVLQWRLGPWFVNGVGQQIAIEALSDTLWHETIRKQIAADNNVTFNLFSPIMREFQARLLTKKGLFSSWSMEAELGQMLYERLAVKGVLVRLIPYSCTHCVLRIGNHWSGDDFLSMELSGRLETID
jgi:cobalamin biosynthetic protein CobC